MHTNVIRLILYKFGNLLCSSSSKLSTKIKMHQQRNHVFYITCALVGVYNRLLQNTVVIAVQFSAVNVSRSAVNRREQSAKE